LVDLVLDILINLLVPSYFSSRVPYLKNFSGCWAFVSCLWNLNISLNGSDSKWRGKKKDLSSESFECRKYSVSKLHNLTCLDVWFHICYCCEQSKLCYLVYFFASIINVVVAHRMNDSDNGVQLFGKHWCTGVVRKICFRSFKGVQSFVSSTDGVLCRKKNLGLLDGTSQFTQVSYILVGLSI
jgi:hypothetical protein